MTKPPHGLELGKKEDEAFGHILKHMLDNVADGDGEIAARRVSHRSRPRGGGPVRTARWDAASADVTFKNVEQKTGREQAGRVPTPPARFAIPAAGAYIPP